MAHPSVHKEKGEPMSLLWGYDPNKCDGEYCPSDCDNCYKAEIEADGFITRPEILERISVKKAKPETECIYPDCEECSKYIENYCTVPMVFSKQIHHFIADKMAELGKRVAELESLVTDEILGKRDDQ
jgi:hypothetical protein